ncbi:hypothetical protein LZ554_009160 [Drepanopeziza brunnea f. sp. 'monogermtubi']|nr:hypothetical protein LZ554_009160 [Drepanopeziza brunnea f. sp. 'monogermtubi']
MSASMDVPHSQNTAPVLEFRCLYTADLRRKQKRWQDGKLKYHTFNKRVMVYDERANFVGDTHWKGDAFEEGEELELDRGSIIVEVQECIGKKHQDLTELLDKRVKEREERVAAKAAASPSASLLRSQATPAGSGLLRPKPLKAVLTPTGHYGRAVAPNISPFEQRQFANDENKPAAKRRRLDDNTSSKNGYAQNLMGATLSLASSKPSSTPTIRYESFKARPIAQQTPADAIDLTMDDDEERRAADERRKVAREERKLMMERPSVNPKRHKKSPPAKNGYASNLTGTTLVFSRPEARQPSKTAPVKALLQVRRTRDPEDSAMGIEPPLKKIAGVSSSNELANRFAGMNSNPTRLPSNTKMNKKGRSVQVIDLEEEPSSTKEDNFLNVDSTPIPLPKRATKRREVGTKPRKSEKPKEATQSRSSSPPRPNVNNPALQPSRSFSRSVTENSSIVEPTSDRPRSGLRIRSRAPRKMMMLMDRSSSRPLARSDSFGRSRATPRPLQTPKAASNETSLSQATMDLNDFCQKQEALLQARLNGTRTRPQLSDESSSDPDNGIDVQTIDTLLSRKGTSVQKQAEPSQKRQSAPKSSPISDLSALNNWTEQRAPRNNQPRVVAKENCVPDQVPVPKEPQPLPKKSSRRLDVSPPAVQISSTANSSPLLSAAPENTRPLGKVLMGKPEDSMVASNELDASGNVEATPNDSVLESSAIQEPLAVESEEHRSDCHGVVKAVSLEPVIGSGRLAIEDPKNRQTKSDATATAQNTPNKNQASPNQRTMHSSPEIEERPIVTSPPTTTSGRPRTSKAASPRSNYEPEHISSSIQSATARFRAMISPSNSIAKARSPRPDLELSRLIDAPGGKEAPNDMVAKPLTGPSPIIDQELDAAPERRSVAGFSSPNSLAAISAAPISPDLAIDNLKMGLPRARLANPATRGKSLQTLAASTNDTTTPLFNNPMPPPAPRLSSRPERIQALLREDNGADQDSEGPVREAMVDGPWSREAFDLFGLHGPPQRAGA